MTCGIYKIMSPSGKCYVGQSVNIERRWKKHCNQKDNCCTALRNAIDKHGKENMTFEILEELPRDKVVLNEREIYYIELYNCISPNGYNLQTGGGSGLHCEETKKKMSELMKGNTNGKNNKGKSPTEETRIKMSEARKGKKPWNKGLTTSDEVKKKQSEAGKLKIFTEEHKQNISKSNKGKEPWNKGKKFNKLTRKYE